MKLLLATSIKFPSELANRIQVTEMTKAFYDCLGRKGFYFGGRNLPDVGDRAVILMRIAGKKKSFLFAFKYLKNVKEKDVTHIYCREEKMLFFMLLLDKLLFHTSAVFILESHFVPKRISLWWRFLLRNIDLIVATSPVIKDVFSRYSSSEKIFIVPHGVDVEQFAVEVKQNEARKVLNLPVDVVLVGYTGTLRTMGDVTKGMDTVLRALVDVKDAHLIAVGGESDDIDLYKQQALRMGIADRVIFRERVSKKNLALYQKACDALLLPMPANQYASMLPLKVFEYMASGRPMIASRLPSVKGVISKRNAFLFEPGDSVELAQIILFVLGNKDESKKRAERAFVDVKNSTWMARAEKIINVINRIQK